MAKKPFIMFHGRSKVYGRPNSVETVQKTLNYDFDIIELDVRKSKDGVLYCSHSRWFDLKRTDTLEKILTVVNQPKIIFLDIKDKRITAEDLKKVCDKFTLEFWIAGYDPVYLGQLKSVLKNYKFVYNFIFLNFKRGLKTAKKQGLDVIKISRWQLKNNVVNLLKEAGIDFTIWPWSMNTKIYLEKVEKYSSLWIAYNDLSHLDKPWIGF